MPVFLFTDVEGSTAKWERHSDAMAAVMARHDALLDGAVEACGGRVVKHTGDGLHAAFEGGAADPLRCALEIQKAVQTENWTSLSRGALEELRVRAAVHAGPAQPRAGDWFGPAVNRAARLMAAAWGGQTLVSADAASAAPVPSGASLVDFGAHLLKDLGEPLRVFGLDHPDLRIHGFPPLRSLTARPHNLPSHLAPFVGRNRELDLLAQRLADPACRLLTLTGPGGIGKSRLAVQAAAESIEAFPDGVYVVHLAAVPSADLIVPAVGSAARLPLRGAAPTRADLAEALRGRAVLLILDNFEHLVADAALVLALLESLPRLKALVTSRESLNVRGEWLVDVRGLEIPADPAADGAALDLLVECGRRASAEFDLTPETRPHALRICSAVGGMPLGIELAMSWSRTLSLPEISREIERSLDFLTTSQRDVPERHRSLRATFDSTWRLLAEGERAIAARLSVFRGGFRPEAAAQVADASITALAGLVEKSIVRRGTAGRCDIHPMLAQYAGERLAERPEEAARVRDAHWRYFTELYAARERRLGEEPPEAEQAAILDEISAELENVRAANAWTFEREDRGQAASQLEEAVRFAGDHDWDDAQTEAGWPLWRLGDLALGRGEPGKAEGLLRDALAVFRSTGDRQGIAWSLAYLAEAAARLGRTAAAAGQLKEAAAIFRALGDAKGQDWCRNSTAAGGRAPAASRTPRARHSSRTSSKARKGGPR